MNKKKNKYKLVENRVIVWQLLPKGRGMGVVNGKEGQIYDDGRRFGFGQQTHNKIY